LRAIFPDNSGVGRGMHEAKRAAEFVGHRTRSAVIRPYPVPERRQVEDGG
jgi:hypothetical protein